MARSKYTSDGKNVHIHVCIRPITIITPLIPTSQSLDLTTTIYSTIFNCGIILLWVDFLNVHIHVHELPALATECAVKRDASQVCHTFMSRHIKISFFLSETEYTKINHNNNYYYII